MLTTPSVEPSAIWDEALLGYELELQSKGHRVNTRKNRLYSARALARHATSTGREPTDITKQNMRQYLLAQYEDRRGTGKVTLYQELLLFWTWYSSEHGSANPMTGIPRPKGEARQVAILDASQFPAVLKACEGYTEAETARNVAIVWLLLESGLRRFELCELDLADVDLKGRTASVRRGKGGRPRVVVFGDSSAKALWKWLQRRGRAEGPLFLSLRGGRMTPGGLSQLIARVHRRSGVQVRPHMFRHAWAHFQLQDGMQENDVKELAGWSSTSMLRIYGAALAKDRAVAAGKEHQVGKLIRGSRE